jgi:SAM-dependent methyltransferase
MDASYAQAYRTLYQQHWWWRAREHFVLEVLRELAPPGGFGRILDVGCGDGLFFPALSRFGEVHGIEPDASLVTDQGRKHGVLHVQPFDADFKPGHRFGLITMLDVLEHLPDPVAALRHVGSLLDDAGKVLITVPAFPSLWTAHDVLNHHHRRYTRASLTEEAGLAGITLTECRYFFNWMYVLKRAVHWKEMLFSATPSLPTIPPPPANHLLFALARLEQPFSSRLPLPFGSSLLAVGTRSARAR